ncbi:MAG: hypothetical protein WCP62_17020, partial [Planctomycetota bacterium]
MRLRTGQINAQIRKIEGSLPMNMQPPGAQAPSGPSGGKTPPNQTGSSPTLPSARDYNPLQPRSARPR